MDTFTASNGVLLKRAESGHIMIPPIATGLGDETQQALREYFQAESDKRMGRWRYPAGKFLVVYPTEGFPDEVTVLDEREGESVVIRRDRCTGWGSKAATAYFEEHCAPAPWASAEPGEVWRFKTDDDRRHALGWVAKDGTWDVMDSRGDSHKEAADPISALVAAGYSDYASGVIAERLITEVSS